ncbi:MAG: YlxR family protein [Rhodoglobus sp.]
MNSVRTCLGCRVRTSPSQLLRVVERDGAVVADPFATMPGRGAWVHPTVECVALSVRRKAFGRALRSSVALNTADIMARMEAQSRFPNEQAD